MVLGLLAQNCFPLVILLQRASEEDLETRHWREETRTLMDVSSIFDCFPSKFHRFFSLILDGFHRFETDFEPIPSAGLETCGPKAAADRATTAAFGVPPRPRVRCSWCRAHPDLVARPCWVRFKRETARNGLFGPPGSSVVS